MLSAMCAIEKSISKLSNFNQEENMHNVDLTNQIATGFMK